MTKLVKKRMGGHGKRRATVCNCMSGTTDDEGNVVHFSDCALIKFILGFNPNFTGSRERDDEGIQS